MGGQAGSAPCWLGRGLPQNRGGLKIKERVRMICAGHKLRKRLWLPHDGSVSVMVPRVRKGPEWGRRGTCCVGGNVFFVGCCLCGCVHPHVSSKLRSFFFNQLMRERETETLICPHTYCPIPWWLPACALPGGGAHSLGTPGRLPDPP